MRQTTAPGGARSVDALLAAATREVLVMSRTGRDLIAGARAIDQDNIHRGVTYRMLLPNSVRGEPALSARLTSLCRGRVDTRTVADVPADAVVVDGVVAVLPADPEQGGPATAMFRLPSVVTTTVELFERVWPAATPLAVDASTVAELGQRERDLLALMSAGCTDETTASRLGVSVRTVRRMVADIMDRLGARSRFQAGVKAAGRGWLMERAG